MYTSTRTISFLTLLFTGLISTILAQNDASRHQPNSGRPDSIKLIADLSYAGNQNPRQMLDLMLPAKRGAEPLPVVVFIHGGGWRNGSRDRGRRELAPLVSTGNYAGVSIGYRLTDEAQWPSQMHDCKAAIRWIRAHAPAYGFDPARIGVFGTSAGGHLVSVLGTTGHGRRPRPQPRPIQPSDLRGRSLWSN
jgi:acetyl esterase/lipase